MAVREPEPPFLSIEAIEPGSPGVYAAGERVGGILSFNYPGGSGLMPGAVFGKIAGTGAADAMRNA